MTAITFDTHKFVNTLRSADFNERQAEAISSAFKDAQNESKAATKADIDLLRSDLGGRLGALESKIDSTRWIMLILVIAVIAPQLKGLF